MSQCNLPNLCVVADDLTGALDAAAPFARRGMRSVILFDEARLADALASGADLVTVSTRSREMEPQAAFEAVKAFVGVLPSSTRIFKKIDSRMKGNVEAELQALGASSLLVAPAIPEFGRFTQQGAMTGFGIDAPIQIATRLGRCAAQAIIPDVGSDGDMLYALEAHPDSTPVGARGLADALARLMTGRADVSDATALKGGRALFIIGSHDPITLSQVERLKTQDNVEWIGAPNGIAPVAIPNAPVVILQALPGEASVSGAQVARNLAQSLPTNLRDVVDVLFLTGGATAEAILAHIGIAMAELSGEVLPGLPVVQAGDLTIITKSGGFGDSDTLVNLAASIEERAD